MGSSSYACLGGILEWVSLVVANSHHHDDYVFYPDARVHFPGLLPPSVSFLCT